MDAVFSGGISLKVHVYLIGHPSLCFQKDRSIEPVHDLRGLLEESE